MSENAVSSQSSPGGSMIAARVSIALSAAFLAILFLLS
jgi:hypothetical protein